jgi:hypothetical protein
MQQEEEANKGKVWKRKEDGELNELHQHLENFAVFYVSVCNCWATSALHL